MLLQAKNLGKRFGSVVALDDVSLELDKGEVVGFLGPNGAGKSTTMKILAGYLTPGGGRANIAGHDIVGEPLACRKLIGYLPQDLPLYPDMTTVGYLDHVARLKGLPRSARRHEVVRVMERCDLRPVEKRHLHKLSGGNRQRVGLAQALLGKPPVLILDEATAGLDPAQVANFRDLIGDLADEHSILLSTHIMAEVEACCHRVVMINQGRNLLAESVADLQARTRQVAHLRLRLMDADDLDTCAADLTERDWVDDCQRDTDSLIVTIDEESRQDLVDLAGEYGGLRELTEERIPLERVFRELISKV